MNSAWFRSLSDSTSRRRHTQPAAVLLLVAQVALVGRPAGAAGVTLAVNGQARVVIASGEDPNPAERTAVKELAEYLGKVTGATFPQVEESAMPRGSAAIYVGHTAFAARAGVTTVGARRPSAVCNVSSAISGSAKGEDAGASNKDAAGGAPADRRHRIGDSP